MEIQCKNLRYQILTPSLNRHVSFFIRTVLVNLVGKKYPSMATASCKLCFCMKFCQFNQRFAACETRMKSKSFFCHNLPNDGHYNTKKKVLDLLMCRWVKKKKFKEGTLNAPTDWLQTTILYKKRLNLYLLPL